MKLNSKKSALLLIDLQNLVLSHQTKPHSAEEVVTRSRALAEAFRAQGAPVIYVRVLVSEFLTIPADEGGVAPRDLPAAASEIATEAGMQQGDLLITKRHWGAFAQTELEQVLRDRGVDTVVLAGIATNLGVESTLRQGTGLGFGFITVEDACSTFTQEMQDFAFRTIFPRLSHVLTTRQVLEALE